MTGVQTCALPILSLFVMSLYSSVMTAFASISITWLNRLISNSFMERFVLCAISPMLILSGVSLNSHTRSVNPDASVRFFVRENTGLQHYAITINLPTFPKKSIENSKRSLVIHLRWQMFLSTRIYWNIGKCSLP